MNRHAEIHNNNQVHLYENDTIMNIVDASQHSIHYAQDIVEKWNNHNYFPKRMRPLEVNQQLLIITMEECGELIQECSKLLRKSTLSPEETDNLKKELGDVYTMINLFQEYDHVSFTELEERETVKREKLKQWSDL